MDGQVLKLESIAFVFRSSKRSFPVESDNMYLVLFLLDDLRIAVRHDDACSLIEEGRRFVDLRDDWRDGLYLGFYDWLRTKEGQIAGITLTLHDGRDALRDTLPERSYINWLSPDIVRIFFRHGEIDEPCSVDQEFSVSRCLRASDGGVALVFDASELDEDQINSLGNPRGS